MHGAGRARWAAMLAAALMAISLAGCGGGDEEPVAETTTTEAGPTGSATVQVEYVDYGFSVSGPLTAGGTLQLSNAGKEFHMMGIGRFKPGKTLEDLRTVLTRAPPPRDEDAGEGGGPPGQRQGATTTTAGTRRSQGGTTTTSTTTTAQPPQDPTDEVLEELGLPGNVMGPGASAELTVPDLEPGSYALVCFLPAEAEGTPHFAKGMIGELEVVDGDDPPPPAADVTYRLAAGKAVDGPAVLSAGRHTLEFETATGSEELEPALVKLAAGKTFADVDRVLTQMFESGRPPPKGAAARVPGEVIFASFDLREVATFLLSVDFTPGNYVLVAEDSDRDPRPKPPKEIITIKVS